MADISNQRETLHKRAERLLKRNPERISGIAEKSVPELVHDLAVHQIELELQRKNLQKGPPRNRRIARRIPEPV